MNNNRSLFLASFMTLIAAGMGFAIRGGILGDWANAFGFTQSQLGGITGGGLVGFGLTIIACSLVADTIGYKSLMVLAFILHVGSAVVTIAATPVYAAFGQDATYWCLYVGMFMFALANGVCESVINPLVATLYPKGKTHYLNILHAGWPGGLIVGALLAYFVVGRDAKFIHLRWEIPICFFLIPTLYYGFVVLKEKFPQSEAKAAGVSFGQMLLQFASPILLFLFLLHAMVGYVELGTDSWITNIMNNVIVGKALLLFIYTSSIMFVLRFFAGPIVERINPIGLLLISAITAAVGLFWLSQPNAGLGIIPIGAAIIAAATVYALGKTFFWPTMLGVVGERFPKGGALTMGTIGGIGMLSAGLIGAPAIGYKQDLYATKELKQTDPAAYERYVAKAPFSTKLDRFLNEKERAEEKDGEWPAEFGQVEMRVKPSSPIIGLPPVAGLDGSKVEALKDKIKNVEDLEAKGEPIPPEDVLTAEEESDEGPVLAAQIYGGRMALRLTAAVPFMMAIGYLILFIYFHMKGGYKPEELKAVAEKEAEETGY